MTTTELHAASGGMSRRQALLLLALANGLWGTAWAVAKVATAEIEGPLLAAARLTLATGLFWVVWAWERSRAGAPQPRLAGGLQRRELLGMLGLGIFGLGASYMLIYTGVSMTTASDGSLMIIGEVIFTALLAAWIGREPLGRHKIGGVLAGSLGVGVLVLGGASQASDQSGVVPERMLGDLLILIGLFFQALLSVLGAGLARKAGPIRMSLIIYSGSLLVWVPLLLWYGLRGDLAGLSPATLLSILYLAAIPSVGCNLIWFYVLRTHGASLGAVSLVLQPLVGSILGVAVLGEALTATLMVGGALILGALALLVYEPRIRIKDEG